VQAVWEEGAEQPGAVDEVAEEQAAQPELFEAESGVGARLTSLIGRDLNGRPGDARIEHLARIELVWPRLARGELTLDQVDGLLERSLQTFATEDDFARGRALHCRAVVDAVYRFRYGELEKTLKTLQAHYERSGFVRGGALFLLAAVAYRGSTPAREGIDRCDALLHEVGAPFWQSFILPMLAVLEAMDGRLEPARRHLVEARLARQEFPEGGPLATSWAALAAEVELLAGDPERAESILVEACASLRSVGEREWLATNTALLAEALHRQRRFQEALAHSGDALTLAPPGHLTSLAVAQRVRAKALAQTGELDQAILHAGETIGLLRETEVLDQQGEAYVALAEVYALGGFGAKAAEAQSAASALFERKGNRASQERIRRLSFSQK
jgi:tetratricopeptide (TPR) repeat protein